MNSPTDLASTADRAATGSDTLEPLVSVVIPCYNQAHFLGEAIESALAQTHPRIEVVVVDDGSADDTAAVATRYPAVRYVRQENRGVSVARNEGLRHSEGEYIIFLDADDRLLSTAAEDGLECFRGRPEVAFAVGDFQWINATGSVTGPAYKHDLSEDPYADLLRINYITAPATVMFRREPLEAVGGFVPGMTHCEDYDLYLRLAREYPVARHAHPVADYRRHDATASSNQLLIAESALTALRRQWRYVRGDRQLRQAYMEGVGFWVTTFAKYDKGSLWAASQWRLRGRGWAGLRAVALLSQRAPHWFGRKSARLLGRKAREVARRIVYRRSPKPPEYGAAPPRGHVRFGDLRRVHPIEPYSGVLRGQPVPEYYLERFLNVHRQDIRGHVLESKAALYTRQFGGSGVVTSDVLDIDAANPHATVVTDPSAHGNTLPKGLYDCVILRQTLHLIYDVPVALAAVSGAMKPGGVLLLSVPGIASNDEKGGGYWGFTSNSIRLLLGEAFPGGDVSIEVRGNVLTATAYLMGLAAEELSPAELDVCDPTYPVSILARAVKPARAASAL